MTTTDSATTLDELVVLVQSHLKAATVMVTRVTDDRQYVLAHAGRPLPETLLNSAALSYSICQHSVAMDFPLVIDDAFSHPLMRGNLAVSELSIGAYIGAPVHVERGKALGAICGIEYHQRRWTEDDVRLITDAARHADSLMVNVM